MPDTIPRSFLAPVTIGRAAEIAALRAFLTGEGGVLSLSGEAGVGKSRLVREARMIAAERGIGLLEGHCFEADRALPMAPAIDILSSLIEDRGVHEVALLCGSSAKDLGRLVSELAPQILSADLGEVDAVLARRRLFEGFAGLVGAVAGGERLLLVVEDIHWADDSSLDLLLHLARRTDREPLYLLFTYRSDETNADLEHFLATLDRSRLAAEMRVQRLDSGYVAAMLEAIFHVAEPAPANLLHAVYALTEGNPFFIEEVLTALGPEHPFVTSEGTWARAELPHPRVPRSVHDAVRRRVSGLSTAAREFLLLAAVAGRRFDFDLLRVVSGREDVELTNLVKELIAAQLVVEEAGDRFAFRHALAQEAVYSGLLDRERRQLHRRVADAIVELQSSSQLRLDDLAIHAFAAGSWQQALDVALLAGRRAAALYAPRAAAEHFTRAIEASRALGIPPVPEIHQDRGRAYETLGEFDCALADYTSALDLARSAGNVRSEWQSLLDLGFLWTSRDYWRSGEFLSEALSVARTLGDPEPIARSLNRFGNWRLNIGEPAEATRLHQEALAIFEGLGTERGVAETLDLLGIAGFLGADLAASAAAYERAVPIWRALQDRRGLAGALLGLSWQGPTFHTDTVPTVRAVAEVWDLGMESINLCRAIDWRAGECWTRWSFLGMALGAAGAYDLALPGTWRALHIAREIEHLQWVVAAECILGNLCADLGDLGTARATLESAVTAAWEINSPYWIDSAIGWLASILVRDGEVNAAASVLGEKLGPGTPTTTLAGRLLWRAGAELALARDEPEQALGIVERLAATTPGGANRPIARLEFLRGEALAGLGHHEPATAALLVARDEAAWSGARPLLWRVEAARARLAGRRGDESLAEEARANGMAIVETLTASVPDDTLRDSLLAVANRELPLPTDRLFVPSAPDEASLLTKREQEVAVLLTEGLTNREIGSRLYVSEWTVATHVRNILGKLELSSRSQVAAWAAERGLNRKR